MIFYDWLKLKKATGISSKSIIWAATALVEKQSNNLPKYPNSFSNKYFKLDLSGKSFLINPYGLLRDKYRWTPKEIAQYIQLASYRNFAEYKITGNLRLKTHMCPIPLDIISKNRLLVIHKDEIIFVYEEYNGEIFKMAGLSFKEAKSTAGKERLDQYEIKSGDNAVRLFGNILPRYLYWPKNKEGRAMPVENLAFNRETQEFDYATKDHVKDYFPDIRSQWGYSMLCIANGEVKIFNFKKKLFQQIQTNIDDLGDPTDPETGWTLCFSKNKTGPLPINIEYTLQPVKCLNSKGPLSAEEKELIAQSKPIEEMLPRPTPEQQQEFLEKLVNGNDKDEAIEDEDSVEELNVE